MSQFIVGFGEALIDVLPSAEIVGGAPLNFSLRVAQLSEMFGGCRAALISRVGADARGQNILQHLKVSSLDTSSIQVDARLPTGYVEVTIAAGQPSYMIGRDVAWDAIAGDERVLKLAGNASAICFGSLSQRSTQTRQTLLQCLSAGEKAIKIFDINLRQPYPSLDLVEHSLRLSNVLKCNEEELQQLSRWCLPGDCRSPEQMAEAVQERFELDCVFWTRGAEGCVLQRGKKVVIGQVPDLPREADADTVGAGDAASAALAVGLVSGWEDDRIVSLANYCGAFVASRCGATAPLPAALRNF